jgi:hypothetical protein
MSDFAIWRRGVQDMEELIPLALEFVESGATNVPAQSWLETVARALSTNPLMWMWAAYTEAGPVGFIVCYPNEDMRGPHLFVLGCYTKPGTEPDVARALDAKVEAYARVLGLKRIAANTLRQSDGALTEERGWESHGYHPVSVWVEKILEA